MDKTLVLSSPATLMIATEGGDYVPVGFTRGGVSITPGRETRNIDADQSKFPLWVQTTARSITINFRLLEVNKQNFMLGWGEPGQTWDGTNELSLGAEEDTPPVYKIKLYGTRMDGKYVIFEFFSCIPTGTGAFTMTKGDEGIIEATFTATYDEDEGCVGTVSIAATTG